MSEIETNAVEVDEVEIHEIKTKIGLDMSGGGAAKTSHAGDAVGIPVPQSYPQTWTLSLRFFRDEAEMQAISSALHKTGWNRKRAAQLLRISYRGLLYKIRRHNIAPPAEHS